MAIFAIPIEDSHLEKSKKNWIIKVIIEVEFIKLLWYSDGITPEHIIVMALYEVIPFLHDELIRTFRSKDMMYKITNPTNTINSAE